MRGRFLWRVGLFVAVLVVFAGGIGTALFLLLASALGATVPGPHAGLVAVVLVVISILVVGGVRRAAGPIGDLVEAAGRVEAGDYSVRVPERGAREIRGVARAFNRMTEQLAADAERRRRLLADVSHELRTPLTVIQGNLEGIQDGVYPTDPRQMALLLDETRTLSRLVDDLRTLSLAEAGELTLHLEPTDLGGLVADVVASHQAAASAGGVRLDHRSDAAIPTLQLDPIRMREVIGNLVANALRHTPPGGTVTVSAKRSDEVALVEVADTGSGMSREAAARAFERFYRDPESGGSGLGLPIARELVGSHGGTIGLTSEPGRGTTVRIRLPIAAG